MSSPREFQVGEVARLEVKGGERRRATIAFVDDGRYDVMLEKDEFHEDVEVLNRMIMIEYSL